MSHITFLNNGKYALMGGPGESDITDAYFSQLSPLFDI
jgi:hypothetical protein